MVVKQGLIAASIVLFLRAGKVAASIDTQENEQQEGKTPQRRTAVAEEG